MLEALHLENYVLFDSETLELAAGLNVISGETGAGKSLIAAAVDLALGARADTGAIRTDTDRACVSAVFLLSPDIELPDSISLDSDNRLVVERQLRRDNPAKLFINGRPSSLTSARMLRDALVEVAAQGEQTRLLEPEYQINILDRFAHLEQPGSDYRQSLATTKARYQDWQNAIQASKNAEIRLAELSRELKALTKLSPNLDRDLHLEERIRILSASEEIRQVIELASILDSGDKSIISRLSKLLRETEHLSDRSPDLQEASVALEEANSLLTTAARAFQAAADSVGGSPGELEACISRCEALKRAARHFACQIADLPEVEQRLRQEMDKLANIEQDIEDLQKQAQNAAQETAKLGSQLTKLRQDAATKLIDAVNSELAELGMVNARFSIDWSERWHEEDGLDLLASRASQTGLCDIEFMLRPNPGEQASPLRKTASGGESSRAMLALKSALSGAHRPPVLILDEIDAGVGARLGDALARKLRQLAEDRQIIVVTHLPQVAAAADCHIRISKVVTAGRTHSAAVILDHNGRINEIAHMIRGEQASDTTRQQAEEMIELYTGSLSCDNS